MSYFSLDHRGQERKGSLGLAHLGGILRFGKCILACEIQAQFHFQGHVFEIETDCHQV